MTIIIIGAVYALYGIDDVKNRDTILYAKFLANLKDRWAACPCNYQNQNLAYK